MLYPSKRGSDKKAVSTIHCATQLYLNEHKGTPMKSEDLNHLALAIEPRLDKHESEDERFKIRLWLGNYEGYLFQAAPPSTYERYSRVLSKFIGYFPEKKFTYDFLRAHFEDYKQMRLAEEGESQNCRHRTEHSVLLRE
jgi:hypothetical protein